MTTKLRESITYSLMRPNYRSAQDAPLPPAGKVGDFIASYRFADRIREVQTPHTKAVSEFPLPSFETTQHRQPRNLMAFRKKDSHGILIEVSYLEDSSNEQRLRGVLPRPRMKREIFAEKSEIVIIESLPKRPPKPLRHPRLENFDD
jgi:hypothetical protein